MIEKNIRIGIIGAGSIGTLFGGYLASIKSDKYSIEVILIGRKDHVDAVNKNGLKMYKENSLLEIKNIKAYHSFEEIENSIQ